MSILILAEHNNKEISPNLLNIVTASKEIGGDIDVIIIGNNCEDASKQASAVDGVNKVIEINSPEFENGLAENIAPILAGKSKAYTHVLAPASTYGKNILPRISAILDVQQISDIISVESDSVFKRPIYAGNAIATVESSDSIKLITVRTSAFDKANSNSGNAEIIQETASNDLNISKFVSQEIAKSERPELSSANLIVSGGRGVGSKENFKIIEQLADKIGAAIGASRAAVDAEYVANDCQVGQTGKIVAPDLYIAVGISGAIQHLAGMKDSKIIVAINKDEEAPIFSVADYGLVADLFDAVPEMIEKI